ncbi:MAG: hypothetical protein QF704_00010 [Anaerolineales bacterium]|jgi:hypothetical protein|nr:hypothetical protein [Anaerolineales bacterium]
MPHTPFHKGTKRTDRLRGGGGASGGYTGGKSTASIVHSSYYQGQRHGTGGTRQTVDYDDYRERDPRTGRARQEPKGTSVTQHRQRQADIAAQAAKARTHDVSRTAGGTIDPRSGITIPDRTVGTQGGQRQDPAYQPRTNVLQKRLQAITEREASQAAEERESRRRDEAHQAFLRDRGATIQQTGGTDHAPVFTVTDIMSSAAETAGAPWAGSQSYIDTTAAQRRAQASRDAITQRTLAQGGYTPPHEMTEDVAGVGRSRDTLTKYGPGAYYDPLNDVIRTGPMKEDIIRQGWDWNNPDAAPTTSLHQINTGWINQPDLQSETGRDYQMSVEGIANDVAIRMGSAAPHTAYNSPEFFRNAAIRANETTSFDQEGNPLDQPTIADSTFRNSLADVMQQKYNDLTKKIEMGGSLSVNDRMILNSVQDYYLPPGLNDPFSLGGLPGAQIDIVVDQGPVTSNIETPSGGGVVDNSFGGDWGGAGDWGGGDGGGGYYGGGYGSGYNPTYNYNYGDRQPYREQPFDYGMVQWRI